jgi:hypothetical protein
MDPITYTIALGAAGAGGAAENYWFTIYYDEGEGATKVVSVAADSAGNVFTGGEYNVSQFSGIPNGSGNGIVKYDKDGAPQFSKTNKIASHNVAGRSQDVAVDSSDNVYLVGDVPYQSSLNHGAGFIAKYNNSGTRQWHKKLYLSGWGFGYKGVAVDSNDNVYAASRVYSGSYRFWLVKYNSSGTIQANKKISGSSAMEIEGQGIAIDSSDNIYLTGISGNAAVTTKLNSSLAVQWSRAYGTDSHSPRSIAVDSSGNVYVRTYQSTNQHILKYNSSGTLQWQRKVEITETGLDGGLTVDSSGNVYFSYRYAVSGGSIADLIVVKLNSSGTVLWKRQIETTDTSDGFRAKGLFHSGDNLYISALIYTSSGYAHDFVGKVPDDGSLTGTHSTTDFGNIIYASSTVSVTTPTLTDASHTATISDMTGMTAADSGMTEYSFTNPDEERITLS